MNSNFQLLLILRGRIGCTVCFSWADDHENALVILWLFYFPPACMTARVFQTAAGRQGCRRLQGLFSEADHRQFLWHHRPAARCGQQQEQIDFW